MLPIETINYYLLLEKNPTNTLDSIASFGLTVHAIGGDYRGVELEPQARPLVELNVARPIHDQRVAYKVGHQGMSWENHLGHAAIRQSPQEVNRSCHGHIRAMDVRSHW